MTDVVLAVLSAAIVFALSAIGGGSMSRQRRLAFWALGLVGIALIGWQTYRAHTAAADSAQALEKIGAQVKKMAENPHRADREGKISVKANEVRATIAHGYDDPKQQVSVFPAANWNTTLWPISQDRQSVTFEFSTPAPPGAVITWKATPP